MEDAAIIFRFALIYLIQNKYVEVYCFQTYVFTKGQRRLSAVNDYFFVRGHTDSRINGAGTLETAILRAIECWQSRYPDEDWPDGPTTEDLVLTGFPEDYPGFHKWLVEPVAYDADARGLGQLKGKLWASEIEWSPARAPRLEVERQITESLSEQLARKYPEFSRVLDEQILRGVRSRQSRADTS